MKSMLSGAGFHTLLQGTLDFFGLAVDYAKAISGMEWKTNNWSSSKVIQQC